MTKILFVISILWVSIANATSRLPKLSLDQAVREAWELNPQIKNQKIQADLAYRDRWRRFLFNEPQFQFTQGDDGSSNSYGLQLTLGLPGKAVALASQDSAKEKAQIAELNSKKYDLAKLVAQAYIDCATSQKLYALQKSISADLDHIANNLRLLYESGHSTQAEKIGAELQAHQAQLDTAAAKDKEEVSCKKFRDVTFSDEAPVELSIPDDLSDSLIAELGTQTSDQLRAQAVIETANATSSTAWWSQMPDLTLSVARNNFLYLPASPSGKAWDTTYSIGLTIPIFLLMHERTEAQRTKSQAAIDTNVALMQYKQADSDVLDAAREYRRSKNRLFEVQRKDLALAEALVESTYSAYRSGKLGYAELILSRKTLNDIKSQEIQLHSSIVLSHFRCLNQCEAFK